MGDGQISSQQFSYFILKKFFLFAFFSEIYLLNGASFERVLAAHVAVLIVTIPGLDYDSGLV